MSNKNDEKVLVKVTTEFVEKSGDIFDDVMSLATFGILNSSTPDHFKSTAIYSDGSVSTGTGYTKSDAEKTAVKNGK